MKVLCTTQGTAEWYAARSGKVTASHMADCLAKPGTKRRSMYLMDLVLDFEGIGHHWQDDEPPWMRDGKVWEAWSRAWYEWSQNNEVEQTGFILHPEYDFMGCSPDGLVNSRGLVEIKFRKFLHTFKRHTDRIDPQAFNQMQFQMACTGRDWCDYVNFWRDDKTDLEKGHVIRVRRDDARIRHLTEAALLTYREAVQLWNRRKTG